MTVGCVMMCMHACLMCLRCLQKDAQVTSKSGFGGGVGVGRSGGKMWEKLIFMHNLLNCLKFVFYHFKKRNECEKSKLPIKNS